MKLVWIKANDFVSGRVYLFDDGFVRMYLGVEGGSKTPVMLFYTLCGVVTGEVSKIERSFVWEDMQRETIRSYLLKAVNSEFNEGLVKKSRVSSLYPLEEFSITAEEVTKWLKENNVESIITTSSAEYRVNAVVSSVVKMSQIELGRVYLCTSIYLRRDLVNDGRYTPVIPISIQRSGYCGISAIPITNVNAFLEDPESYVISAYNSGNVEYIRNKRLFIPHGEYDFLAEKYVEEDVIKDLLAK